MINGDVIDVNNLRSFQSHQSSFTRQLAFYCIYLILAISLIYFIFATLSSFHRWSLTVNQPLQLNSVTLRANSFLCGFYFVLKLFEDITFLLRWRESWRAAWHWSLKAPYINTFIYLLLLTYTVIRHRAYCRLTHYNNKINNSKRLRPFLLCHVITKYWSSAAALELQRVFSGHPSLKY